MQRRRVLEMAKSSHAVSESNNQVAASVRGIHLKARQVEPYSLDAIGWGRANDWNPSRAAVVI